MRERDWKKSTWPLSPLGNYDSIHIKINSNSIQSKLLENFNLWKKIFLWRKLSQLFPCLNSLPDKAISCFRANDWGGGLRNKLYSPLNGLCVARICWHFKWSLLESKNFCVTEWHCKRWFGQLWTLPINQLWIACGIKVDFWDNELPDIWWGDCLLLKWF